MLKPRVWFDVLKLRRALANYPAYSPPNTRNEIELPLSAARENFRYFKTTLASRMTSFRMFMQKFGVDATTNEQGLIAVSEWFKRYGGLLLYDKPRSTAALRAFVNYDPPWIGKHIGINVVWDVGVYVGECIIARRSRAHWDVNTGNPDPMSTKALGFHRPCVGGLYWPTECDPITQVYMDSQSLGRQLRFGYSPHFIRTDLGDLAHLVTLWSKPSPSNPASIHRELPLPMPPSAADKN